MISFCFQGWASRVDLEYAYDHHGNRIPVADMDKDELVKKLRDGDLTISLTEVLNENPQAEIEIFDFD